MIQAKTIEAAMAMIEAAGLTAVYPKGYVQFYPADHSGMVIASVEVFPNTYGHAKMVVEIAPAPADALSQFELDLAAEKIRLQAKIDAGEYWTTNLDHTARRNVLSSPAYMTKARLYSGNYQTLEVK